MLSSPERGISLKQTRSASPALHDTDYFPRRVDIRMPNGLLNLFVECAVAINLFVKCAVVIYYLYHQLAPHVSVLDEVDK